MHHHLRSVFSFSSFNNSINLTGEIPVIDLKTVAKLLCDEKPQLSAK
jgi:hypothetical protein